MTVRKKNAPIARLNHYLHKGVSFKNRTELRRFLKLVMANPDDVKEIHGWLVKRQQYERPPEKRVRILDWDKPYGRITSKNISKPNELDRLSSGAKGVYMTLLSHADQDGKCRLTAYHITDNCGCESVQARIRELVDAGFLSRSQTTGNCANYMIPKKQIPLVERAGRRPATVEKVESPYGTFYRGVKINKKKQGNIVPKYSWDQIKQMKERAGLSQLEIRSRLEGLKRNE